MITAGITPEKVLVLCDRKAKVFLRRVCRPGIRLIRRLRGQYVSVTQDRVISRALFGSDINELSVMKILWRKGIPTQVLSAVTINDKNVIDALSKEPGELIFFNGRKTIDYDPQ